MYFFSAFIILPLSLVAMPFVRRKEIKSRHFVALGVDFQREPEQTLKMIEELGVESLLLRLKLWEMERLEELEKFILQLPNKKITLKILQDRENIEDLELLEKNLETIFTKLHDKVALFEIGSTINRAKWGFFSVAEYNRFFQVAYNLKQQKFPNIKLMGSEVIDFEYHMTAHTLFNFAPFRYDAIGALLYVDRRGAPENTQLGFNLLNKITWLATLTWLSPKVRQELHITEVNWPLSGTAPYAPTSEKECVSEEAYANFMLRYYLLAFATQQVNSVAWHQLIAPGYGLVDNRHGVRKREAFETFKFMQQNLKDAQFLQLDIKRGYYICQLLVHEELLQIHWSCHERTLKNEDFFEVYSKTGKRVTATTLTIGASPLYIFIKKAEKINASEQIK